MHEVAQRAIRRLDVLEWVILLAAALLASPGGAAVAWMLGPTSAWDFRSTWIGASLVLFVVPGTIAIVRSRREERADALGTDTNRKRDDG